MKEAEAQKALVMVGAYGEFTATITVLHDDVGYCAAALRKEDTHFGRRAFVRALFAMIEGVIYRMKQIAVSAAHQPRVQFSPGELQVLSEKSFELDQEGRVVERRIKSSLRGTIRFAFTSYSRVHMAEYHLDVTRADQWGVFLKSIDVRDRLMHPRNAAELIVSDEEIANAQETFQWFMRSLKEVQEVSFAALVEDVRTNPPESAVASSATNPKK